VEEGGGQSLCILDVCSSCNSIFVQLEVQELRAAGHREQQCRCVCSGTGPCTAGHDAGGAGVGGWDPVCVSHKHDAEQ
jgi:hypothetical protein